MHQVVLSSVKTAKGNISALTGLRGIAALWVAVYHFGLQDHWFTVFQQPGPIAILSHGYLAVDVFFVLSGFVMAMSYGQFIERLSIGRYIVFLIRRLARVYPLYFLVLHFYILHSALRHGYNYSYSEMLTNLLMIQSWGLQNSIVAQSWSVSAELAAYVLFPVLYWCSCKQQRLRPLIIALSLIGLILTSFAAAPPGVLKSGVLDVTFASTAYPVIRCLSGFCLGLICFSTATVRYLNFVTHRDLTGLTALSVMLAICVFQYIDIIFVMVSAIFIMALSGNNLSARVFGMRPLVILGDLSYSIYLIHGWLIEPIGKWIARVQALDGPYAEATHFAVWLGVIILLSLALHHYVERPARVWVRGLEDLVNGRSGRLVQQSETLGRAQL